MRPEVYLLPIFFTLDVLATYIFMCMYKDYNKKWYKKEVNLLVKWGWKKWGLHKGTWIIILIDLPFIALMVLLSMMDRLMFGMFIGVYIIILLVHYVNFIQFFEDHPKVLKKKIKWV